MVHDNQYLLSVTEVSVIFWRKDGPVRALAEVSLSLRQGEFVGLEGPIGAGKSLLLSVAAGERAPSAGTVLFDRTDLYRVSRWARSNLRRTRIGYLPELPVFRQRSSILESVLDGVPARLVVVARERAERLLEEFGLSRKSTWRASELSAGESQVLGLVRALAPKPDLLVADCPTRLLDDRYADKVAEIIKDFHLRGGTVLIASADPRLQRLADRVLRLEGGGLVR